MPGFLDILSPVSKVASGILDRIWPEKASEAEKTAAHLELTKLLEARDRELVAAQRDIIVAELQQSDNYTKRARPTIMYAGLFFVLLNHVLIPITNRVMEWWVISKGESAIQLYALSPLNLPENFWWVWGGVCGLYVLGRSAEKGGSLFGGGSKS